VKNWHNAAQNMKNNLRDLIDHRSFVTADQTVGQVFQLFSRQTFEFMGVLEGERLLGMCAKHNIGLLLGTQYGYSLFAHKAIRDHLMTDPVCIVVGTDIHDVFRTVFARTMDGFYDDVLLTGLNGEFIGLIHTLTLIKLQNRFHLENIHILEEQQRELNLKNAQIQTDLRMSRELQQALLPVHYPTFPPEAESSASSLKFYHSYHPLGIVGGDFFHVRQLSDFIAGIFIADVMGHGVPAALITAMLRALLEKCGQEAMDPGQLLAEVNSETTKILAQIYNETMFATALYLVVDAEHGTIRYATAGHPSPIHVRNRLGLVETMEHPDPGTILGVFENAIFPVHEMTVEPEDWILLFTDGIFEFEDVQGLEFGLERLKDAIKEGVNRPIAEAVENLLINVRNYSKNNGFSDDVCLLAVDINSLPKYT
jgi:serine phosphatase RsbU (regulator of sigma subunit)